MRSKTSSFDITLFWKTVCRFWPVWALYAIVWTMALPMSLGGSLSSAILRGSESAVAYALRAMPLTAAFSTGVPLNAIFALFAAMAVYSHLYNPRTAGAYASLPLKREGVFTSVTLAGLAPLLCINVLMFAISAAVELSFSAVYMPALWNGLAISSMAVLFFFGFAAFCAQLTGSLVVLPFLYAVLNFAVYAVEYVVRQMLVLFVYGYSATGSASYALIHLSPVMGLYRSCGVDGGTIISSSAYYTEAVAETVTDYSFYGWGVLGVYAAVGAALLVLALLLYRRRRMESAGDVVAVRALRPVFKYCMAVGGGLCIGLLLYAVIFGARVIDPLTSPAMLTFMMLIGCFIGYFAAEMLLRKSFAVFRGRVWVGFCITCAVLIALMVSCETDLWGYEKNVPAAESVERISVSAGGETSDLEQPDNIVSFVALHRSIVENKALHEDPQSSCSTYLNVRYSLKDGSMLTRRYDLVYDPETPDGDAAELERLINTPEAISSRKSTDFPFTQENITYANVDYACPDPNSQSGTQWASLELTAEEANELYYTCILPDIRDCTLGRLWLIEDDDYENTVYHCNIYIECAEYSKGRQTQYQSFYTVPTADSVRTNEWLSARGVELMTYGEYNEIAARYDEAYAEKYPEKYAADGPVAAEYARG